MTRVPFSINDFTDEINEVADESISVADAREIAKALKLQCRPNPGVYRLNFTTDVVIVQPDGTQYQAPIARSDAPTLLQPETRWWDDALLPYN